MTENDSRSTEQPPPAQEDAHAVPRQTTPAWESELLLSIGLVVGLLQIPAVLDARFDAAFARAADPWLVQLMYAYLYAKVAVYGLVGTFVVHLLARGYWVALLGLRSVFPGGVRWEELTRLGPIARGLAQRESVPMPRLIEQVDNFASGVFAFGFILLATAVSIGFVTILAGLLATLISQFLPGGHLQFNTALLLISLVIVPFALAQVIDRRLGGRLVPGGRAWRLLERVLSAWRRVFGMRIYREMLAVFASNIGQRRATWLLAGTLYLLVGAAMTEVMVRRNAFEPFRSAIVPREGAAVLERAYYADQRGDDWRYSTKPFVQSDVVEDPYLRLFVPISPRRFPAAVRDGCPDVALELEAESARESERRRALLDCLGRLLAPHLDGTPVATPGFEFSADPASSLPGLVAHVPLTGLAAGRHELTLRRVRSREDEGKADQDETIRIAFWR